MKTIGNEDCHFESIDDHFYKIDLPEVLEQSPETGFLHSAESLASAFTLASPILLAMIATPLIPERWQEAIDTLVSALDDAVANANEPASEWRGICRFAEVRRGDGGGITEQGAGAREGGLLLLFRIAVLSAHRHYSVVKPVMG